MLLTMSESSYANCINTGKFLLVIHRIAITFFTPEILKGLELTTITLFKQIMVKSYEMCGECSLTLVVTSVGSSLTEKH